MLILNTEDITENIFKGKDKVGLVITFYARFTWAKIISLTKKPVTRLIAPNLWLTFSVILFAVVLASCTRSRDLLTIFCISKYLSIACNTRAPWGRLRLNVLVTNQRKQISVTKAWQRFSKIWRRNCPARYRQFITSETILRPSLELNPWSCAHWSHGQSRSVDFVECVHESGP